MIKIKTITGAECGLVFDFEEKINGDVFIAEYTPELRERKYVRTRKAKAEDGKAVLEYLDTDRAETYKRFFASSADDLSQVDFSDVKSLSEKSGIQYVEHITSSLETYDYPTCDSKKGLQVVMVEDAIELGVKHAALNVNLCDFMMSEPDGDNTINFRFNGEYYYIRKRVVERNDAKVKELTDAGIIITFICLNSRSWNTRAPDDFWAEMKHPDFAEDGTISAFNVMTEKGCRYYMAFIAFLTERYTRPDKKYGASVGLVVGNEVNSGYWWCNAGLKTIEEYTYEYTTQLRLAWQVTLRYYKNMRIYISLDHFWTGANFDADPKKYYGSKFVLENINGYCLSEGNIGWNIAHHPYPEDLNYPDFWNDKTATNDPDTYRITFKNLEVLAEFTYDEKYLFEGKRRRIILSEQGFNSHFTPESEVLQAMAYGKAYKKIMQIPEIDSFILHAHCDNIQEFGLNLGLWRRFKDNGKMEAPKPIYYVFKAIDKKDEKGVYHFERY